MVLPTGLSAIFISFESFSIGRQMSFLHFHKIFVLESGCYFFLGFVLFYVFWLSESDFNVFLRFSLFVVFSSYPKFSEILWNLHAFTPESIFSVTWKRALSVFSELVDFCSELTFDIFFFNTDLYRKFLLSKFMAIKFSALFLVTFDYAKNVYFSIL